MGRPDRLPVVQPLDVVPHPVAIYEPGALGLRRAGAPLERLDQARTGAPGDVEARHRVAVRRGAAAAALGPADDREDPVAHRPEPGSLLAGGEGDVGLRPASRPMIVVAV